MPLQPQDSPLGAFLKALHQERIDCILIGAMHSRKHFDKEERIVFPLAEHVLKSKTLTQLGQTWTEQRTRVMA